jgi:hypothetical protein
MFWFDRRFAETQPKIILLKKKNRSESWSNRWSVIVLPAKEERKAVKGFFEKEGRRFPAPILRERGTFGMHYTSVPNILGARGASGGAISDPSLAQFDATSLGNQGAN